MNDSTLSVARCSLFFGALGVVVALTGCGGDDDNDDAGSSAGTSGAGATSGAAGGAGEGGTGGGRGGAGAIDGSAGAPDGAAGHATAGHGTGGGAGAGATMGTGGAGAATNAGGVGGGTAAGSAGAGGAGASGSAGASGQTNGGAAGAGGEASCTTLKPPPTSTLVHLDVTGARAAAVTSAIADVLAAQKPPVDAGARGYNIPDLGCGDLSGTPGAPPGNGCSFDLMTPDGSTVEVTTDQPSTPALALYDALVSAGVDACVDTHGDHVLLRGLVATPSEVSFDNVTTYVAPPSPNFVVSGPDASDLVAAFAAASVNDCVPTRSLYLVCNAFGSAPSCGYSYTPLHVEGGSTLVNVCGPGPSYPHAPLSAGASLAVWNAFLRAATDAGFKPDNGTVSEATVLNASSFQWDGTHLGCVLTLDDAAPPPGAPDGGVASGDATRVRARRTSP